MRKLMVCATHTFALFSVTTWFVAWNAAEPLLSASM